jgi:hypothetical protein
VALVVDANGYAIEFEKEMVKETPMNKGIIRNALTTKLALELEYREASIFETESEQPTELQFPGRLSEDEFICILSMI